MGSLTAGGGNGCWSRSLGNRIRWIVALKLHCRPATVPTASLDLIDNADAIFPSDEESAGAEAYHRDIDALHRRFEVLLAEGLSLEDLNVALLSLLERYTWAMTSASGRRKRSARRRQAGERLWASGLTQQKHPSLRGGALTAGVQ